MMFLSVYIFIATFNKFYVEFFKSILKNKDKLKPSFLIFHFSHLFTLSIYYEFNFLLFCYFPNTFIVIKPTP